MSEINTLAELEELPIGAVVTDVDGDEWQKQECPSCGSEEWFGPVIGTDSCSSRVLSCWGPFKVVADPGAEHDRATCGPCDEHADATLQADRDETALGGAQ